MTAGDRKRGGARNNETEENTRRRESEKEGASEAAQEERGGVVFETHARTRPCGQTDVFDHAHLVKRIRGRARAAAVGRSTWRQGSGQTVARKAASLVRKIAV